MGIRYFNKIITYCVIRSVFVLDVHALNYPQVLTEHGSHIMYCFVQFER